MSDKLLDALKEAAKAQPVGAWWGIVPPHQFDGPGIYPSPTVLPFSEPWVTTCSASDKVQS